MPSIWENLYKLLKGTIFKQYANSKRKTLKELKKMKPM